MKKGVVIEQYGNQVIEKQLADLLELVIALVRVKESKNRAKEMETLLEML